MQIRQAGALRRGEPPRSVTRALVAAVRPLALALALTEPLALPARAETVARSLDAYPLASWSEFEGTSLSGLTAITQDRHGYIWLGGSAGLVRFDGARFVRWESLGDPLPEKTVTVLYTGADGSLWVGYHNSGGVSRIQNGTVRHFTARDGLPLGPVLAIREDRSGTLWVGGFGGLARSRGDGWERLGATHQLDEALAVYALHEDHLRNLWVGTRTGVLRLSSEGGAFESVPGVTRQIVAILEDRRGAIWFMDAQGSLQRIAAAVPEEEERQHLVTSGGASRLLRDRRGHLWGAPGQDLLWISQEDWTARPARFSRRDGLIGDGVLSLFEDREGNVWIGTSVGLTRVAMTSGNRITAHPALSNRSLRAVAHAADGSMWAGGVEGLFHFDEGGLKHFHERHGLPDRVVTALHIAKNGAVWVATTRGVGSFSNDRFTPLRADAPLTRVVAMTSDHEGALWLCDYSGLYRWANGVLTSLQAETGHRVATAAFTDRGGRVWIGFTSDGLVVFDHGTFQAYTPRDGLPEALVSGVLEDAQGEIWVSTTGGLARFRDGRFTTIGRANGLPDDVITAVVEDGSGGMWLGTGSGIARVDRNQLLRATVDPPQQLQYRLLDASDGFIALQWAGSPTSARGRDGALSFISRDGIRSLQPGDVPDVSPPPTVLVERILTPERPYPAVSGLQLPPWTERLRIDFTSLTFAAPSKVRFRYRLEGFDRDWVQAETRRQVFYTNLPPRNYRFEVAASSLGGPWNDATVLEFSIKPAFYQTTWFVFAVAASVALTGWSAWRYRVLQLRRKYSIVLDERARVGREIHDTLLQGMVGVALQLGVAVEAMKQGESAQRPVERARESLERYIRETRSSIWELRSHTLEARGLAGALREMTDALVTGTDVALDLRVHGEPIADSQVEQQCLRIVQEAVSNALRHSGAQRIAVDLAYEPHRITLVVADDGGGFRAEGEAVARGKWGLRIMRERAAAIGAEFTVTSTTAGTTVELVAALPRSERRVG